MTTSVKVTNIGPRQVLVTAINTESGVKLDDSRNCILDPGQETPELIVYSGKSIKVTEQ
jgi:hypothetical protein